MQAKAGIGKEKLTMRNTVTGSNVEQEEKRKEQYDNRITFFFFYDGQTKNVIRNICSNYEEIMIMIIY